MIEHNRRQRASDPETRLFQVCWLRVLPVLLLGLLFFGAGCAKQSPAPQTPEKTAAVTEARPGVIEAARSNIGVPYRFGGTSPETGFDCSGFVRWSYEQVGIQLPRRASEQYQFGDRVAKKDLRPGDIVVFKGSRSRTGWHSGIYTGEGMFIHSPNKGKAVTESTLESGYFAKNFVGACRIPPNADAAELYAAFQERQRSSASAKKAGKSAKKAGKKTMLVAEAPKAKAPKNISGARKNSAEASKTGALKSVPHTRKSAPAKDAKSSDNVRNGKAATAETPLRGAVASTKTGKGGQADAVVGKLKTEQRAAPRSARTEALRQTEPAAPKTKSGGKS